MNWIYLELADPLLGGGLDNKKTINYHWFLL